MASTIKTDYPNSGFEHNNHCQYGSNLCVCVCVCVCLCNRDISDTFQLNNGLQSLPVFSFQRLDQTNAHIFCVIL